MRKIIAILLCVVLLLSFTACAKEKTEQIKWPTGNVTIYVGAKAGANMDLKARIVAKYLASELGGVSVVVENKAGAGGVTVCTDYLAEKANTNNLILMAGSYLSVAPVFSETIYKSEDFITVAGVDNVENGIFVNAKSGIKNLKDLQDLGKTKKIKFGSAGVGNDTFLIQKVLYNKLGLNSDTVASPSVPECLLNVMMGVVDVTYSALNLAKQYVEDGSLVCIGTLTEDDYTGYSDIKIPSISTVKSQGQDMIYSAFSYFAIRKGTSDGIVNTLSTALERVYANPAFQKEFIDAGFVLLDNRDAVSMNQMIDELIQDVDLYAKLIS